jgi:uncharacterized protein
MRKVYLKQRIQRAIKNAPHLESIKKVALFGSQAYGKSTPNSDIDILIEFKKNSEIGFFAVFDIEEHLSKQLNKKVDLHTSAELSRFFRASVLQKAEPIYEI